VAGINTSGVQTDQRGPGFFRTGGSAPDIGAFEVQKIDVAVSTSAPAGPVRAEVPATFTLTVTNNGPAPPTPSLPRSPC
jgi:hypothetical protein